MCRYQCDIDIECVDNSVILILSVWISVWYLYGMCRYQCDIDIECVNTQKYICIVFLFFKI